jgi:hypothetical protein
VFIFKQRGQKEAGIFLNFSSKISSILTMNSEWVMSEAVTVRSIPPVPRHGIDPAMSSSKKGTRCMTKTLDVITEIIRNPKHPFRKADDRPVKAQKHRYERRKIKEFIRLSDWEQKTA